MKTLHDRYCLALEARGYQRVPDARTGKYTVFHLPADPKRFIFVGFSGALRQGHSATASIPCSSAWKGLLLADSGAPARLAEATLKALGLETS
jgi:hypothetical protein